MKKNENNIELFFIIYAAILCALVSAAAFSRFFSSFVAWGAYGN